MSDFVRVGQKSDFKNNWTTGVAVNGLPVCIARINNQFSAFHNECTHAAAQLSDCDIEEGCLSCPLHGATFNVTSGAAVTLPAVEGVKMYEVKVEGDEIFVKL